MIPIQHRKSFMSTQETIYITDRGVAIRYRVSRPTVWRWLRMGHLPPPEKIGPNTKRWRVATLDNWDASRADQPIIK